MDDIDKPPEDSEAKDPQIEETLLDLPNVERKIEHNNFELEASSHNPEIDVDVEERRDESGENSGNFSSKDMDTVNSSAFSETPNSLNGPQEVLEKNVHSSVRVNQSSDELMSPKIEDDYTGVNIDSEPAVLHKQSNEVTEALSESPEIVENVFLESESPVPTESVITETEAPGDTQISAYSKHIQNEFSESELQNELVTANLNDLKDDLDQSLYNVADPSEQRATSEGYEIPEIQEFELGVAEQVYMEAAENHSISKSEHSENVSGKLSVQEYPEMEVMYTKPEEFDLIKSGPIDIEHQDLVEEPLESEPGNEELQESENQRMGSNFEDYITEEPLLPTEASFEAPESRSFDLESSVENDFPSINGHEEGYEENNDHKDVSKITANESDLQSTDETYSIRRVECVHVESSEPNDDKVVQIGIEGELKLEEGLDFFTNDENNAGIQETPNVGLEERPLSEASYNKVFTQAYETIIPVYFAFHEAELMDLKEAHATHNETEIQTMEIHSEPVKFRPNEGENEKLEIESVSQESKVELETANLVSLKISETIPETGFQKEENERTLESERIKPETEKVVAKEQIFEVIEAQPSIINEPAIELEVVRTPLAEAPEMIPEIEMKKGVFTEVAESLSLVNDQPKSENHVNEPQATSTGKSLNEKTKLSGASDYNKENATLVVTNGEADEKEPNISDEELDFDTRYALFVGRILPGHEVYYMPANKKKVAFRKGGTLDQRQTNSGSSFWDASLSGMWVKSATLGAPRRVRHRLQPKPSVNDDHLFPDSVTPSKVEKTLSEDDTSASNDGEGNRYDVPFMDDDAFVAKKYRNVVMVDDDSSSDSDYSSEKNDLIAPKHLEKMDETSPHVGMSPYYVK